MKKKITMIILMSFMLTGSLYISSAHAQYMMMENPLLSEEAPDFTLETTEGVQKNLTNFRDNQNAIIFYWATWCPHCRVQLKELNEQKENLEAQGVKVIPVDVGEDKDKVQKYLKKNKIDLEVFLDTDSALSQEYALVGVPSFFFLNQEGIVLAVEHAFPEDLNAVFNTTHLVSVSKKKEIKKLSWWERWLRK